ncbi:MAG: hypothetical protein JXJ20_14035 [Anaerolineae bacterium]|nr:hypothetical protein [Anaerolineae bacterium]
MRPAAKIMSLLLVLALLLPGGVLAAPDHRQSGDLEAMVNAITADGVGRAVEIVDNGSDVPVIIFHENHDSILGQIEIAIMLNRLYRDYGATHIYLEGAYQPLDASWFHALPGDELSKASIFVQHLADGEISHTELMALVRPAVTVQGIDDEALYKADMEAAAGGAGSLFFLLTIASLNMPSDADMDKCEALINTDDDSFDRYIDCILAYDDWAVEMYEPFSGRTLSSTEDLIAGVDAITARADELGLLDYPGFEEFAQYLQQEREFYVLASQRTDAMVDNVLASISQGATGPQCVSTGSAHTARMTELFDQAGYSYAVIEADSLQASMLEDDPVGVMTTPAYNRKSQLMSVDAAGRLGALLEGRDIVAQIKPESVLGTDFYRRKSAIDWLLDRLVNTLFRQDPLPDAGQEPIPYGLGDVLAEAETYGIQVVDTSLELVPSDPEYDNSPPALFFEFTLQATASSPAVNLAAKAALDENGAKMLDDLKEQEDPIEPLLFDARGGVIDKGPVDEEMDPDTGEITEEPADPVFSVSPSTIATVASSPVVAKSRKVQK